MRKESRKLFDGYAVKVLGANCLLSGQDNRPIIFPERENAEMAEMDLHSDPFYGLAATKVVKVEVREVEENEEILDKS